MMKKRLLFFLMTLFCLSFLKAQTVQTTNGTLTQGYIPMYVLYEYSYTQHIVLKSELENGGWNNTFDSITKLRWHWDGIGNFNTANTWEIYLGNTSKTAFSSTTDWVALADLTEVFNGEVTFPTSAGWIEVELDQPFAYDGVNNLVIAVNETVPGWGTPSPKFISTNVGESRGLYKYQDSSPFYPATPPIGVVTAVLPNLQVYFQESCPSPNNVHLTSVTSTTATIGWNLGDEETGWNLEYREVGDADWTLVSGLTSMTYQITNLTPNTQYQVRLQSDCVTEQSNFTAPIAFYTSLIPVQLPYFNDFENAATYSDFQLLNGTQTNQWVISGAPNVNNTDNGSYAMYISNDPTTDAWAYSAGATVSPSRVYAFCDVEVPAGVAELKLTFDWIANGASATNDFLRVYWMPVNVEVVPGQNPPTVGGVNYDWEAQIGNHTNGIGEHWLSQQTTWQQAEFVINTTQFPNLAGNTWRLYFHWRNGTAIAAQPPATVDNISIEVVECPTPSQLTISNTTATTVDLAWTENGDATSWFVEYKKSTEDTWASEMATSNPYTVQNLESSTTYQFRVQSNCGTELSPYTSVVSTTTLCAPVTVLPWDDSFESISYAGTLPLCWAATNFGSVVYTQTSNDSYNRIARTGTRAAYFRWNCNDHIFTPAFELQANVSYDFSFWYVTDGWSGWQSLKANVYSAQTPDSLILQLAEVTNVTNMTYQKLKGTFTPTEDGIYYFGTFCQATGDPYYLTVDDFVVSETPSCVEPTDLTVTNITTTGAEINFVPVGTDYLDFKVMWRVEGEQTWEEITLNGVTTYQLTNLTPNTLYQIRVATDCLDGSYSDFVGTSFRTACADIVTFPYTENFDNHGTGEGSFPTCWSYLTNYTNPPTCSSTYSVSSPNSLYAYSYNNRYTILIAPKVDDSIDLSDLQVSFYARGAENQYVHLGVIEDPTSPSSFVTIQSFPVSSFLAQYTGYLANYTGTSKYVAIKVAPTTYVSYYFDDFVLDYAPDCPPVSNIAVSNVGATSALVSWSPNGTPDSYNVEVILAGDATGTQYTTSNNHYILTGLNEVTDYTVSVSPSCSGVAGPAVSTTFTTNCALGGDVIVGTPEATTNTSGQCLPCHTYYNYSYSQQIFDAAEVSDIADTVHGIAFQYFYGTNITRNIEIYLGHTDQATYTATSDYVPGGAFVKVYDGSVEFTNTGENNWHSINFTTPFVYDADSNLVITVIDKTGSYVNGVSKFRTHATNETKAIAFYQDTGSPYTLIPSGGNSAMYGNRNNVKFITPCQVATCYPPNLIAEYVGSYSVDYQILPVASENSWEVEYKLSEETNWTSVGVVNTTTNSLTNLAPYTQYDLRVRSLCGTSDMSIWKEVSFTTLAAIPATIPYSCDFENPVENAEWSFKNSGQTNQWYIGNASNNPDVNNTVGGANALYISNDGGDTWAYTAGADNYSKSYAFRDFVIPATATELRLTIDWIANGAGANDMLRLFWVLPDANINAGAIPAGTVNVDAALATSYGTYVDNISLQGVTDWQESSTFTINNTQFPNFAGKTWRLYFMWRNDVTTGDQQPPAVVDNITLEAVTCPTPFQLAATTATQNSVTLSWTETGYATTWNVEYKKASESTWSVVQAYGTPFEVQNLDHSTNYMFRVQSDCGNGEVSGYSSIITEQTLCAPVVTLPWDDSFESITAADEFPTCWLPTGVIGKLKTQIVDYGMMNRNARTGTKCAYFVYSANNTLYTPAFELQAGVSYDFSFWYVTCGNEGWTTLQSAVYSSQSSITPLQVLTTLSEPDNQQYELMTGTFVPQTDGVYYFGVHCEATYNPAFLTMDDFSVSLTPDCVVPSNLTATNVTAQTADIDWTETGEATQWEIEYGEQGFTQGTIVQTYSHPYTLTGLNDATTYEVRVRAVCDVNESSAWSPRISFFTPCLPSELPFTENFSTMPPCWSQSYSGGLTSNRWSHSGGTQAGGTAGEMKASYTDGIGVSRLISPLIRFNNAAALEFSFKHYYNNFATGVTIKLQCSPDLTTWTDLPFSHNGGSIPATTETIQFIPIADSLYFAWVIDGDHYDINAWYVDDVSITAMAACFTPTGISYSNATGTAVDIAWVDPATGNTWEIEYGAQGFTHGSGTIVQTSTNPTTITGLTASTCYDFYVRAICGPGETSNWSSVQTFCTAQTPINVPFTIDFETPSEFVFENNSSGANWYVGGVAGVNNTTGGTSGLYVSSDNGVTNVYDNTIGVVWAYRDIYFTPSTSDYTLTFDWKCNGEVYGVTGYDYFRAYIGTPTIPVATTTNTIIVPTGATALGDILNEQTTWQTASYTLASADYSGQTMRLYFAWTNDGSTQNQPPAAIDNIAITSDGIEECTTPTNLQVANVTNNSAEATWIPGGTETSWQVDYKLVSATNWTTATATTTSYTMIGLQSNAQYHVRVKAICTSGESEFTAPVTFTTGGGTVTYTITATAGPNGTITPSGAVTVNEGASQTFTFTPNAGYQIDAVLVDNVPVTPVPTSYTFNNVQSDHTIHVDFTVGITENELSQYVTLYPNPTQSFIDLKLDRDYLGTTECHIYDMYGKLMRVLSVEEEITTIDVSDFAAGVYFVRLTTEQGRVSKRFVKQ